jgi:hypothetical protein
MIYIPDMENITPDDIDNVINKDINKTITVVDYVKNYKTGEIIKLEKIKPIQASINKATVQIFDEKGDIIQEGVSHNVINNAISRPAYLQYYYQYIFNRQTMSWQDRFFDAIYLTDYGGAEDANEVIMRGNIIGWAGRERTYAGADTKKGTFNAAESILTDINRNGYFKFIFDWPTHSANGVFNSIWWAFHRDADATYYKTIQPVTWGSGGNAWNDYDYACDGNYFYRVTNSGIIYRVLLNLTTAYTNVDVSSVVGTSVRGIEWDGTFFWIINHSDKKVYKGTISGNTFTGSVVFTANQIGASESTEGLTFFNNKIFIHTQHNVYRYNQLGTLEDTIPSGNYGFGTNGIRNLKANNAWMMITGYDGTDYFWGKCDNNGNLIDKQKVTDTYGGGSSFIHFCFVRNTKYANSRIYLARDPNSYDWPWKWSLLPAPGAHTLLAAPVTKNNTNTMKITYEFNVDLTRLT